MTTPLNPMLLPEHLVSFEKQDEIGVLWINHPPVNALNRAVRSALADGITAALQEDDVLALVLMARGKLFCAGADIREFGTPLQFEAPILRDIFDILDQADKPVVVAMQGIAVGGAVELALSCHYRLAAAGTRFSLPEVKLGLIPGSGGTQRLTRLIGPEKALSLIVSGDPISTAQALKDGLVDDIITGDLAAGTVSFARTIATIRPLPRTRDMTAKTAAARTHPTLFADWRNRLEQTRQGLDAPQACVDAIFSATTASFEEGMQFERKRFIELLNGSQSAALRRAFFAKRPAAGSTHRESDH